MLWYSFKFSMGKKDGWPIHYLMWSLSVPSIQHLQDTFTLLAGAYVPHFPFVLLFVLDTSIYYNQTSLKSLKDNFIIFSFNILPGVKGVSADSVPRWSLTTYIFTFAMLFYNNNNNSTKIVEATTEFPCSWTNGPQTLIDIKLKLLYPPSFTSNDIDVK